MRSFGRRFAVFSSALDASPPVELHSIERQKHRLTASDGDSLVDDAKSALVQTTKSLPFFGEIYNISADIRDYVMVPVVIMPSELPNRNCVGFPYEELTRANAELGQLGYQTFTNKPTFRDHINKDHTQAKGMIFASSLRPMKGVQGGLWKVVCLCGFDRSRDPVLANSILNGERNSYSMGAWTGHFTCTICGAEHPKGPCDHVSLAQPKMFIIAGQLAYLQARDICGFECSSVEVPAYVSAETPTDRILNWS